MRSDHSLRHLICVALHVLGAEKHLTVIVSMLQACTNKVNDTSRSSPSFYTKNYTKCIQTSVLKIATELHKYHKYRAIKLDMLRQLAINMLNIFTCPNFNYHAQQDSDLLQADTMCVVEEIYSLHFSSFVEFNLCQMYRGFVLFK